MKKSRFPSRKEIDDVLEFLSDKPAAKVLAKNAGPVDRVKYRICQEFVLFKNNTKKTQKEIAEIIGTDESIVSKIIHYHIEDFTIDRLFKLLSIIYPNIEIKFDKVS